MQSVGALPIFTRAQKFIGPFVISRYKDRRSIDLGEHVDTALQSAGHCRKISGADDDIYFARFGDDLPRGFKIGVNVAEE